MDQSRLKAEMDLFHKALDLPPDQRDEFVTATCAHDPHLAERVLRLLHAHTGDQPTEMPAQHVARRSDRIPETIGSYRVLERIGEGGMGVVFLAEQTQPVRRRVAIKLVKSGEHSAEIAARFHAERQALALMDHESIARIINADEVDGRPYFVMEYVPGAPIAEFCDNKRLTITERLRLFQRVCQAVHHAHQKGIIHRDLKPSNILVTENDGEFVPKIIDFGIAKAVGPPLIEQTLHTRIGQMIGTPEYMSPEQAVIGEADIDTRSDVYSLGVILYELLIGTTPFGEDTRGTNDITKIQRIIREQDPVRPSNRLASSGNPDRTAHLRTVDRARLGAIVRGDLDWIAMRCLEKDRARRYDSVAALANDIRAHLENKPVDAGPPGYRYRLGKFARRNSIEIAVASVFALGLAAFAVGGTWVAVREHNQAEVIAQELAKSEAMVVFAHSMITGVDPAVARGADTELLETILEAASDRVDEELAGFPEAAVDTLNAIGDTYLKLGKFAQAESTFKRAATNATNELGRFHSKTIESKSNLAVAFLELTRFDDAINLMEEVVETCKQTVGESDTRTYDAFSVLGAIYSRAGRDEDAVAVLEPVLEERLVSLGSDDQSTLLTANNLAVSYSNVGRIEDAIELQETVLESQIRTLGEDHPQTLATIHNLAGHYLDTNRFDEAERMLLQALEVKKRILEPDHPSILNSMAQLGSVYNNAGRYEEAYEFYSVAAERCRETLGAEDLRTLTAMNGTAIALMKLERYDEAEPVFAEAVQTLRALAGDDHPSVMTIHGNLLGVWVAIGRSDDVLNEIDDWILRAETGIGPAHPATIGFRKAKALALIELDRADEAETLLLDNYNTAIETHGPDSRYSTRSVESLIKYYDDLGRTDDADQWRAKKSPDDSGD